MRYFKGKQFKKDIIFVVTGLVVFFTLASRDFILSYSSLYKNKTRLVGMSFVWVTNCLPSKSYKAYILT
ncbi:hypothetical protein BHL27_06795 [Bacillus cereus]|nr:hypothetical protein BHL27_06795 [Bacillus cereus]